MNPNLKLKKIEDFGFIISQKFINKNLPNFLILIFIILNYLLVRIPEVLLI